jgi:hypothetical protein
MVSLILTVLFRTIISLLAVVLTMPLLLWFLWLTHYDSNIASVLLSVQE